MHRVNRLSWLFVTFSLIRVFCLIGALRHKNMIRKREFKEYIRAVVNHSDGSSKLPYQTKPVSI